MILKAKPECGILQGVTRDREYYVALAHEIASKTQEHRGITLTARFDTRVNKTAMIIPLLTLWNLYKTLAKIEGISTEHILPIRVENTPTYHNNSLIINCSKENRDKMADIGNTILTIWPRFLKIALGNLGTYMPLELHICIPKRDYKRYGHASTSLIDFNKEGIHRFVT